MKKIPPPACKLVAALFVAAVTASAAQAATTNIALNGTAILGFVATASDTTYGTNKVNTSAPPVTDINDGILADRADNFSGSGAGNESFVGITFATPQTLGLGSNVTLYLNLYVDGGWFGVPGQNAGGAGTGTGGSLVAGSLVDPHVQYTSDGTTWLTLTSTAVSDNYVSQYTGATTAVGSPPGTGSNIPATFTLNTALTGITGIRLTGTNGGSVGLNNDGFLGVQELQVNAVPEPSVYALVIGGAAALVGLRRFAGRIWLS